MEDEYIRNLKNQVKIQNMLKNPETKKRNEPGSYKTDSDDVAYINDLNTKIQVEDMLLKSWGGEKKNEKSKAFVPHEMEYFIENPKQQKNFLQIRENQINEYLEEQKQPIVVNGKQYKFHQVDIPELDDEPFLIEEADKKNDLQNVEQDIMANLNFLNPIKIAIDEDEKKINELNTKIATLSSQPPSTKNNQEIEKKKRRINFLNGEIQKKLINAAAYESELQRLSFEKDGIMQDLDDIKLEQLNNKKENELKIKSYTDELELLNTGLFSIDRMPEETEKEYLDRISKNAQMPYDDDRAEFLAQQKQNTKFMENLKYLIRDNSKIETILNYFKSNNKFDVIYNFNKYFEKFKIDYLDIYGYNNKNVSTEELLELIKNYTSMNEDGEMNFITPSIMLKITEKEIEGLPEEYKTPFLLKDIQEEKEEKEAEERARLLTGNPHGTFDVEKYPNGMIEIKGFLKSGKPKSVFLILYNQELKLKDATGTPRLRTPPVMLFSKTGEANSFIEVSNVSSHPNFIGELFGQLGIDKQKILDMFSVNIDTLKKKDISTLSKKLGLDEFQPFGDFNEKPFLNKAHRFEGQKKDYHLYGWGIKEDIPEVVNFGDNKLLLKKLFQKNILSLQNKRGLKIAGFPNKTVSDELVKVIMKIAKGEKLSIEDMSNLKLGEKELLDNMLYICGLQKKIITGSGNDTITKTKKELELIEGEIEAGNNNNIVKERLYKTLFKLVHFGIISEAQARKHYKEIVKDFF